MNHKTVDRSAHIFGCFPLQHKPAEPVCCNVIDQIHQWEKKEIREWIERHYDWKVILDSMVLYKSPIFFRGSSFSRGSCEWWIVKREWLKAQIVKRKSWNARCEGLFFHGSPITIHHSRYLFLVRHPQPFFPFENALKYAGLRFTVAQLGVSGLEPGKLERKNGIDQLHRFFQIVVNPVTVHDSRIAFKPFTIHHSQLFATFQKPAIRRRKPLLQGYAMPPA